MKLNIIQKISYFYSYVNILFLLFSEIMNNRVWQGYGLLAVILLGMTGLGLYLVWPGSKSGKLGPDVSDIRLAVPEKCVDCHHPSADMSPWHRYERIGCVSCHLGNADEADALAAHTGMIAIPGNLVHARQTCGAAGCHPGITERVENSLMSSMSGVVNIQRYFFGEIDTLDAHVHVKDLGHSPADSYTRNLCASCHLGREKMAFGPVTEKSRGGGCNACHLNYTEQAAEALANHRTGEAQHFHPSLTLHISDDHCFGCHSRSGRISTSYQGWHESQLTSIPGELETNYRRLDDGRIFVRMEEDVHHKAGLECIDCHSGMELMGDGRKYYHAEEAVRIRCADCHFNAPPKTSGYGELDYESQKIVDLRAGLKKEMEFVRGSASNYPLVNVIRTGQDHYLIGKNSNEKFRLSPQNEACSRGKAHDDLSCSACHAAWAPQCIRCHVEFNPNERSVDLLDRRWVEGKWIETGGHYLAELPGLGVMYRRQLDGSTKRQIEAFIPGMILNADPSAYPMASESGERFARLFAPIEPHTTRKEARDCKSCHRDPTALGYGRGELNYNNTSKEWSFKPFYPLKKEDGLPEDAWIGLWEEPKIQRTTRSNARPFNLEEQERILTVGICLDCHAQDSPVMLETLFDFKKVRQKAMNSVLCKYE